MINLCIPFNTVERIGNKLSKNSWTGYATSRSSAHSQVQIASNLEHAMGELVVTLAHSKIKTNDLFNLQIGDVISTEKDIHTPLEVEIEGVVKYLAVPGAYKGKTAIEIRSIVERDVPGKPIN
jgi:flagellar motor switch protein FliM